MSTQYHDLKPIYDKQEIKNRQNILKKNGWKLLVLKGKTYDEIFNLVKKYRPNIIFEFDDKSGHMFLHHQNWGSWNVTFSKHTGSGNDNFWIKK